jgi:thiamine-monophosphate kinase
LRLSERQLVERIGRQASQSAACSARGLVLKQGIGDDCAVIGGSSGNDLLITTDLFLEGVHFRREWQSADSVGHKVLARGLSDIAAMGGTPRFAFLSVALPPDTASRWVDEFFEGLLRLAKASGVTLAGGDTAASHSTFVADIMVIGEAKRGTAVLRSGAKPGDEIWISGSLGGAAAALGILQRKSGRRTAPRDRLQPLLYPLPRLAIGDELRRRRLASAMMDLSDGLSIDLARLCQASGVGARISAAAIPRPAYVPLDHALHGGEDFELLFTIPAACSRKVPKHLGGVPLTRIGAITRGRSLRLLQEGRESTLPVRGFEHF